MSPDKIALLLKSTSSQLDLLNLQFDFVKSSLSNCSMKRQYLSSVNQEVGAIGKTLLLYEKRGTKNKFYYFLKTRYHIFQIKLYMLYKEYFDRCHPKENVILYMWSDNNESKEEGKILDGLVKKYPLHVFAVQYNYSQAYAFIQDFYNITYGPTLVVNYNVVLKNLTNASVISRYLVK